VNYEEMLGERLQRCCEQLKEGRVRYKRNHDFDFAAVIIVIHCVEGRRCRHIWSCDGMRLKGLEERGLIFILRVVRVRVVLLYFLHATRRVDPKAQPWFDEARVTV
jgi:hypothetical protein